MNFLAYFRRIDVVDQNRLMRNPITRYVLVTRKIFVSRFLFSAKFHFDCEILLSL